MSGAPLMLGVSGLRGIVGQSLTPEVAARFAGAFGRWVIKAKRYRSEDLAPFGRPTIVIGRDGRAGGDAIQAAAISGLRAAGCDVRDIGIAMTPTIAVAVDDEWAQGGMVVTASHNPQVWNGLKCLVHAPVGGPDACAPARVDAEAIIAEFLGPAGPSISKAGELDSTDSGDMAEEHVLKVINLIGQLSLAPVPGPTFALAVPIMAALDSVNGSGIDGGRRLIERLGSSVVAHLGADASGIFPHQPEPLRENLIDLCRAVLQTGAQAGFAQDPDADRLAIVDERGEYIGEEYTLSLAAESLLGGLEARPPTENAGRGDKVLITNLSTSRMLDDLAARYGARVVRTAVGEANVVEAMKREKAAGHRVVLGGEGNGGVIWPEVTYVRDSLSAMALVLALMARTGKKVSELVADIPAYAIEKRKVDLARKDDAAPAVEKIAAAYRDQKVDRQDGVRVDWTGRRAWLHVRASNTEPIMRLIAEAPTGAEARAILDEAARIIAD